MARTKTASRPRKCPRCGGMTLYKMTNSRSSSGKDRWRCTGGKANGRGNYCYSTVDPDAPYRGQNGEAKATQGNPQFRKPLGGVERLVITWAQNATPLHEGFWNALLTYAKRNRAQLIVIPGRYKNPTSRWTQSQENAEHWLVPEQYLYNQRKKLNNNLVLLGDIKIQPTAISPLTGFEALTHGESGIFGGPKLQLKSIATPQQRMAKILTTTGACTIPNYTDSRAGKAGEFHHVQGAVVVDIESPKIFRLRHINARKDGAFIDKNKAYFPDGTVEDAPRYKALVLGDAHKQFADPAVVGATFNVGGLVDVLDPEALVWHDLLDCYAGNPHHQGNPFIAAAKQRSGFDDMRREVEETIQFLIAMTGNRKSYIVSSNHDDMLQRWIMREDWKRLAASSPDSADFYLQTARAVLATARISKRGSEYIDAFQYWVERIKGSAPIECVPRNRSLLIGGVECSMHGDEGPNGARGTIKNLARIGVKSITGHGHSPGIEEGHYRTGTMTPPSLEYTGPVGSWLNAHCSIDGFDKRHLHICVEASFF